jgi:hypothetical protein
MVAQKTLEAARRHACGQVLVLSNARYEALGGLLRSLRGAGVLAESARTLEGTAFGCHSGNVYAVFAEMLLCSESKAFLGSRRSQFSHHIAAMRDARGEEVPSLRDDARPRRSHRATAWL